MGQINDMQQRIQLSSYGTVDFQSIRDDNTVNPEYHAFMALGDINGEKGLYMIVKIVDPATESVLTYHFNYNSGKSGNYTPVEFETAWANRATLNYVRYDKVIQEFFYNGP